MNTARLMEERNIKRELFKALLSTIKTLKTNEERRLFGWQEEALSPHEAYISSNVSQLYDVLNWEYSQPPEELIHRLLRKNHVDPLQAQKQHG